MKKQNKVDVVVFKKNKYPVDEFISKTIPDWIVINEAKVSWWHRLFNTKKYRDAKTIERVKFYEEFKIMYRINLLNFK